MLVDEFRFSHHDIMRLPFRTYTAYQRLAMVRRRNGELAASFD